MPKSLAKRRPAKKSKSAAKSQRPVKKTSPRETKAKPSGHVHFMWKLLRQKEAELKSTDKEPRGPMPHSAEKSNVTQLHPRHHTFARFVGPRRKAAV